LGTFVVGSIKLQIYGLSANSAGGTSNLVGNLINQGSTTALFTTIQTAQSPLLDAIRAARLANSTNNQSQSFTPSGQGTSGQGFRGGDGQRGSNSNAPQFIGDLSPDSPIPISVSIGGLSSLKSGPYQVAFKVVYADDLKNFHTVILNGTIFVTKGPQSVVAKPGTILDQIPLPPPVTIGIIIVVAAGVITFLMKKKRSAKKKLTRLTQGDTDIVSIFGDTKKKENES
jgi:hypothetical protein